MNSTDWEEIEVVVVSGSNDGITYTLLDTKPLSDLVNFNNPNKYLFYHVDIYRKMRRTTKDE